jgi:hypothetical protein
MKQRIEQHIMVLLGNKPDGYVMTEQRLYMIMFLYEGKDEQGKCRINLFNFQKGMTLPYSDRLFRAFRNPQYIKGCWISDERGCRLTEKGRRWFREAITRLNTTRFKKLSAEYAEILLNTEGTTDYELELVIQLKHYKWIIQAGVDPTEELNEVDGGYNKPITHSQIKHLIDTNQIGEIEKMSNKFDYTMQQVRKAMFVAMNMNKKIAIKDYINNQNEQQQKQSQQQS